MDHPYRCVTAVVAAIDRQTREEMASVYLSIFEATDKFVFEQDLNDKDEALLLYFETKLVGFTTLKIYPFVWNGDTVRVLFSGDTVVDRQHWGQQVLSFAWVRHLGKIKQRHPYERLVWFLLVKGHRTYRYLHVFAKTFYPGKNEGRDDLGKLASALAYDKFPHEYNSKTGIIEFTPSRGQLRQAFAEPRPDELARSGVNYFLQLNQGYLKGHELVCVCDVEEANMKPLTLRLFRQGLHD